VGPERPERRERGGKDPRYGRPAHVTR
jgi:hypothetical protein